MRAYAVSNTIEPHQVRRHIANGAAGSMAVERWLGAGSMLAACAMVLWAGVTRDLGDAEATLAIASTEAFGPFGRAFGGWMVGLPSARVLPSWLLSWMYGRDADGWIGLAHVPSLLASLGIVFLGARRCRSLVGPLAGALCAIALACSLALNERPMRLGFDPVLGLCLIAALDRLMLKGSDLVAGAWAALAMLMGGWPALAVILLPTIVLGRAGAYLSWKLLVPPVLAFVGWSIWALNGASPAAWGSALVGPLKQPMSWMLVPAALALTLPWSPFALLAAGRDVRGAWTPPARAWLTGWSGVFGVLALAGTLLPGLTVAALPLAFAAVVVSVCALTVVVRDQLMGVPRGALLVGGFGLCASVVLIGIPYVSYLAAAVPYYRNVCVAIAIGLAFVLAFAAVGAWQGRARWSIGCLVALALLIKCAHAEIYTPEWNYRIGHGPWGRAIGQWVPPRAPLYVFQPWPPELAFSTGRSVRALVSPGWLEFVTTPGPHYMLLLEAEYEHWPKSAPEIERIREFRDAVGRVRVLARTKSETASSSVPAHAS